MESWTIIILGATGDLAHKRLIPTLYKLLKHQGHSISFIFVGAAKERADVERLVRESVHDADETLLEEFIKCSSYERIDFDDLETFYKLAKKVDAREKEFQMSGNRLFYLATSSEHYCMITKQLVKVGLAKKQQSPINRTVYEKPFGWDMQSAQEINDCIKELLDENQIYRVDHYITKALTTSISLLRFSNILFEPVWNAEHIEQVQIILEEKELITGRGSFYDRYGAIKDVVQNHMFQLLCYIALEQPAALDANLLSEAKAYVLKHLKIVDGVLGQYQGYHDEPGVDPLSSTETYALLKCEISTPQWRDVPIYLKTGKGLNAKSSEVHIVFKPMSKKLLHEHGFFESNRLILRISPYSGVIMRLNIQKGFEHRPAPLTMDFCYRCSFGQQPHSYETLFYDIIAGDKTRSVSAQEIHYAWRVIDEIPSLTLPLYKYQPGGPGPVQAETFAQKCGIVWYDNKEDN